MLPTKSPTLLSAKAKFKKDTREALNEMPGTCKSPNTLHGLNRARRDAQ